MSQTNTPARAKRSQQPIPPASPPIKVTRADMMIGMMRADGGATAQALAEAAGWQVHSVRGFIAGTLKKRSDLIVTATRSDGVTRYSVADVEGPAA
jgi:hypothetical protein